MAIALNLLGFDDRSKISCQVSPVSHVWLCLANCGPRGLGYYRRRKCLVLCDLGAIPNNPIFDLVLCLRCLRFCFIVDCVSCVRIPYVMIVV